MNVWIQATRPKTLFASIVPVLMGSATAWKHGSFTPWVMLVTVVCSACMQIISNFINEIEDFRKGADTPDRVGPTRAIAQGLITPKAMAIATATLGVSTFLLGLLLVWHSSWITLAIGVLSLLSAWAYTGGPKPLAYIGLGEVFAFIFYGIVAMCGTFYVQTGTLTLPCIIASLTPALLSANILLSNNIRDVDTDKRAGKITLAVRIGERNARILYVVLLLASLSIPLLLWFQLSSIWYLLPMASSVLAPTLLHKARHAQGAHLNSLLAGTGALLFVFGLLYCIALLCM